MKSKLREFFSIPENANVKVSSGIEIEISTGTVTIKQAGNSIILTKSNAMKLCEILSSKLK